MNTVHETLTEVSYEEIKTVPVGIKGAGLPYHRTAYATKDEMRKGLPELISEFEALGGEIQVIPRGRTGDQEDNRSWKKKHDDAYAAGVRRSVERRAVKKVLSDVEKRMSEGKFDPHNPGERFEDYLDFFIRVHRRLHG